MKKGILLVNIGTPEAPTPEAVGSYLTEFLMDPRVIDIPFVLRWLLVHRLIVPKRKHDSAKLYQKVWTVNGSPLMEISEALARKAQALLGDEYSVRIGMRYGAPSIAQQAEAFRKEGCRDVLVIPMYPQYSLAATESSVDAVQSVMSDFRVQFVPPFYDDEEYLDAVVQVSAGPLKEANAQKVIFSFHGLPEKHVRKTDPTRSHCLKRPDCCDKIVEANRLCYRAQSFQTARRLANKLGIATEDYFVTFQSRLNARWIRPFSDEYYRTLGAQGIKRVAIMCPSFVADCLETLEEVAIRGNEEFIQHGGERLTLIPSLNASDVWANWITSQARKQRSME